jgi:hypothetical protein
MGQKNSLVDFSQKYIYLNKLDKYKNLCYNSIYNSKE